MTAPSATTPELEFVFNPRSIAIAGVSAKEGTGFGGGGFVSSLQEIGFRGPIYLIHPTAPAIRGIKCYHSLADIPDSVDYVISSVNARFVPQLLEDCIAKGVRVLHLFTAGFTETGDRKRDAQAFGLTGISGDSLDVVGRIAVCALADPIERPLDLVEAQQKRTR